MPSRSFNRSSIYQLLYFFLIYPSAFGLLVAGNRAQPDGGAAFPSN